MHWSGAGARGAVPQPTIASLELTFPAPPRKSLERLALPAHQLFHLDVPEDLSLMPPGDKDLQLDGFGMTCAADVRVEARPGAILRINVSSPCTPHAPVTVSHAGLGVKDRLDATGMAVLDVPALSAQAEVAVAKITANPKIGSLLNLLIELLQFLHGQDQT